MYDLSFRVRDLGFGVEDLGCSLGIVMYESLELVSHLVEGLGFSL